MRPTSVGKDTQHEQGQSLKKLAYVSNYRGPLLLTSEFIPISIEIQFGFEGKKKG